MSNLSLTDLELACCLFNTDVKDVTTMLIKEKQRLELNRIVPPTKPIHIKQKIYFSGIVLFACILLFMTYIITCGLYVIINVINIFKIIFKLVESRIGFIRFKLVPIHYIFAIFIFLIGYLIIRYNCNFQST